MIYTFKNKETGEEQDYEMHNTEIEQFTADHPELERVFVFPGMVSQTGTQGVRTKLPSGFKDVMKNMEKKHPLAYGVKGF